MVENYSFHLGVEEKNRTRLNGERKDKTVYKRKEVNRDFLTPPPPRQEMVENYSFNLGVEEKKSNKVEWRMKRERIKSSSIREKRLIEIF